ncbi:MAG: tetratricopeptide repeat protein [Chromatiales bacterium]|jgi:tetratricopeptide (TPR) repeat protein
MKPIRVIIINAFLFSLVTGCTNLVKQQAAEPGEGSQPVQLRQQTIVKNAATDLSSNLVYDMLASEIAAQRGEHDIAFEHAMNAAEQSRDPQAAERATHLALHANQADKALQATQLWIEIDPNSLKAHQYAALLNTRLKAVPAAIAHLREVARIANLNGMNGYLQAAAIAEKSGEPKESLILMQNVIPSDTTNPEALYALALTAIRAQQYTLAEQKIRQALKVKPGWSKAIQLLSRTLALQDRQDQGLTVLDQALAKAPDDIELRLTYAKMLIEAQRLDASLKQFEILNNKHPNNPDIIHALGVLSVELERYRAAKNYFNQLIRIGQKTGDAHFYLGLIAEKEGDTQAALQHFTKVEGNNQADARIHMAKILARQDELDEARELIQQLRFESPQNGLKLLLIEAEILRDVRQYELAQEVYAQGLELYEDNPELLYARALNAAELGRVDLLEQDLHRLLKLQPDHADALNALGYTLADQTDRLKEAKGYILKALALKPDSPAILDSMGWVEYRMGDLEAALKYLQRAATISPDPEIAAHLGEILWQMNKKQEALRVWRQAEELDPDNRYIVPVMQRLGVDKKLN